MQEPLSCQVSANIQQSLPMLVFPLSAGFQKEAVAQKSSVAMSGRLLAELSKGLKDLSGTS